MKKMNIALAIFYLFVSQSYGSEIDKFHPGDEIATSGVNFSKARMLETGVLTQSDLEKFEEKGSRIAAGLKEASEKNNEVGLKHFMRELDEYASEYERLCSFLK